MLDPTVCIVFRTHWFLNILISLFEDQWTELCIRNRRGLPCACGVEERCFCALTDDPDCSCFGGSVVMLYGKGVVGRIIELIFVESACFYLGIKIVPGNRCIVSKYD